MFTDAAIQVCLTLKALFGLPLRQTTGMVASLLGLAGLDWPVPDYSTTFFDIGLGYLIGLGSVGDFLHGASLRAEVRYRIDAHGREQAGVHTGERKSFYEGVAGLGLLIPIGAAPAPAATAIRPSAPFSIAFLANLLLMMSCRVMPP